MKDRSGAHLPRRNLDPPFWYFLRRRIHLYALHPIPWVSAFLIYHGEGKSVKVKTRTSRLKGGAKEDEQQEG